MDMECEILLVEDNPDDAELTLLAFEEGRICNKMTWVKDGQEALDYLFSKGKYEGRDIDVLPTVILLDLKLPKVAGLDVLKHIRENEHTSCLPVVILTSSKEDEDIIQSYLFGANAFVRKPVNYEQFLEAAKTLGLFWLVLNETPPRRRSCIKE
jgi:two-component system response regulator